MSTKRKNPVKTLGFLDCTRQGSNLKPSVPKFVKASFRVSDAGENPGFSGVFAFTSLRSSVPKAEKTRISGGISGGTLNASFHPEQPRHARRGHPGTRSLHSQRKKSDIRSRLPLSLVPDSLVPRSLFPTPSLRTDFLRHGSHRCCGKAGGGLRLQRTRTKTDSIQVPRDSNIMRHVLARDRP